MEPSTVEYKFKKGDLVERIRPYTLGNDDRFMTMGKICEVSNPDTRSHTLTVVGSDYMYDRSSFRLVKNQIVINILNDL